MARDGDVGYDVAAAEGCVVPAGGRGLVDTGLRMEVRTPPALAALGLAYHVELKGFGASQELDGTTYGAGYVVSIEILYE